MNDLAPGVTPSFRLSPIEGWRAIRSSRRLESGERGASSSGLSHDVLDGVAGPAIYRGDAYPAEFRGQLFVGDAQSNLVHRRLLLPRGVSFESKRADPGTEFIRSGDNWFRPVNVVNAPDGTLYVLDMYREVIESVHVPLDVFKKIDYTRGRDRGRIYRIAPQGFRQQRKPSLSKLNTAALVTLLEHRGGWWRDTAQRMLLERQDKAAVEPLRKLVRFTPNPATKVQAMYALAGLQSLAEADLLTAVADRDPHVREHAVRLAEGLLASSPVLVEMILALSDDPAERVRFQVAFTLGEMHTRPDVAAAAIKALVRIAARDGADPWVRAAIFSSSAHWPKRLLMEFIERLTVEPRPAGLLAMLEPTSELAGTSATPEQLAGCVNFLAANISNIPADLRDAVLLGVSEGQREAGGTPAELSKNFTPATTELIEGVLAHARRVADDSAAPPSAREHAVRMLGCGRFEDARDSLAAILDSSAPEHLRMAALRTLGKFADPGVSPLLLGPWQRMAPGIREAVLQTLLSRPERIANLFDAVAAGEIPASQIGGTQRTTLLNHSNAEIAQRAGKLWNDVANPRAEVIAAYQAQLNKECDAARGEKVYERECAACHQLGQRGYAVGPNLALARHRTAEELLIHILDPNREVQPAYVQYVVTDTNGGIFAGLVATDTSTSITLRQDRNVERTILKSEIDELASTDKSLMAEGFEKTIKPEEMADLIAYLKQIRYDLGTDPGHEEPRGK